MQNAPFTKAIEEKLFDLPKHHPKLEKVKEYEKSNSKNARNTKHQNFKPVKNNRSGLLVLIVKATTILPLQSVLIDNPCSLTSINENLWQDSL